MAATNSRAVSASDLSSLPPDGPDAGDNSRPVGEQGGATSLVVLAPDSAPVPLSSPSPPPGLFLRETSFKSSFNLAPQNRHQVFGSESRRLDDQIKKQRNREPASSIKKQRNREPAFSPKILLYVTFIFRHLRGLLALRSMTCACSCDIASR